MGTGHAKDVFSLDQLGYAKSCVRELRDRSNEFLA
jgi:hypothetical protein